MPLYREGTLMPSKGYNSEQCIGVCFLCGKEYQTGVKMYRYKTRHNMPTYCPTCVRKIQSEAMLKFCHNHDYNNPKKRNKEWQAPCGNIIVRGKYEQRCSENNPGWYCCEYEKCLDIAVENNWLGWRLKPIKRGN
jgi:hypothetical protein